MFDKNEFLKRLKEQCNNFNVESIGAWVLAENVFCARISEKGEREWVFAFYYDKNKIKPRDSRYIDRTLQLLMFGLEQGVLSQREDDSVVFFHFAGSPLGRCPIGNPENALNYASQMLVRIDGSEVVWPEFPEEIDIKNLTERD